MEKPRGEDDDDSVDRISELPQPILHHILSFLSQNGAPQTCVLSKSWHHLWRTRPNIELCEDLFVGNPTFTSILDQTLERYHLQNLSINRLVVKISVADFELRLLLKKWVPIVLMNLGVETFHLIFPEPDTYHHDYYYYLPSAPVFFRAKFLKELYLSRCKISSSDEELCLKRLQTLLLKQVYVEDETLAKIMASCPLIERVELDNCNGLTTVKVDNLSHFVCLVSSRDIEINVPSALEVIRIMSCRDLYMCNINTHHFPHLKSLYLCHVHLSKESLGSFSCNSPCLEDLELRCCSGFKEVEILSFSVKRLIIVDTQRQIKTITIDAPGLLYFELSCPASVSSSSLPTVSFATVASREWKSNISVPFQLKSSDIDILPWFFELNEVLEAVRQSQITLTISCDSMRVRRIQNVNYIGSCYEPVVVEDLNLWGFASSDDFGALFNRFFRIFRPRYIYTRLYPNPHSMPYLGINKLAEFIWKTNHKDGRCYFWQQELKDLRLQLLDHDSKNWCLVSGSSLPVIASPKIRFVFDWSDSVLLA